jgi:hypothetical protein
LIRVIKGKGRSPIFEFGPEACQRFNLLLNVKQIMNSCSLNPMKG